MQAPKKSKSKYTRAYRKKCIDHYGGNPPRCACCGEDIYQFLAIDHIHGGGNSHRKSIHLTGKKSKYGGQTLYLWLIKNKFPEGYQVLCHNCNLAKGYYGQCPHKSGD